MKSQSGFSLISVLFALVLLAVGITALARSGAAVVEVHSNTALRTQAIAIARGHMELIRGSDPDELASETAITVDETGRPDVAGKFVRSVTVEDVEHNLVRVEVVVDYPRATQPVQLVTMAYVPATTGT
jgi:Tfp pilus assembly protein PilV